MFCLFSFHWNVVYYATKNKNIKNNKKKNYHKLIIFVRLSLLQTIHKKKINI